MAIRFQVLGKPGRDNCVLLTVDSGQRIFRLLFDCGAACLETLTISDVMSIDALCFSHAHMDHISGFDHFFRCNFGRTEKPNVIYGPPGISQIIHHRLQGFLWNLNEGSSATWNLADIESDRLEMFRAELSESFSTLHAEPNPSFDGRVIDEADFHVSAIRLKHHGVSIGYRIDEKPRVNIDISKLNQPGIKPGPWMQKLKANEDGPVEIGDSTFQLSELRKQCLVKSDGESFAYLTDFLLDEPTHAMLVEQISGCQTVVCEAQYRHSDLELAIRNHHTTTKQVASLAKDANVGRLILFHLSDRYNAQEWSEQLLESQSVFTETAFPDSWGDEISIGRV